MKKVKDNFKAFMLEGATLDGKYEIPIIPKPIFKIPNSLISVDKLSNGDNKNEIVVDFYCDLNSYDNENSLWDSMKEKGSPWIEKLNGYMSVIEPNYKVSIDIPFSEGLYNTYRSRTLAFYLSRLGYNVIPNVRWSDASSYYYSFSGIEKHSTVAVYVKNQFDSDLELQYYLDGFIEMVFSIEPEHVLLKGKPFPKLERILNELKVDYYSYE